MPEEIKPPEFTFTWIFVDFILLGLFGLWLLFILSRFTFLHWSRYGVFYLTPYFPAGNVNDYILGDKSIGTVFKELYDSAINIKQKITGIYIFSRPGVVITDPELINTILVKDFDYFQDRGMFYNGVHDPVAAYMTLNNGSKWKNIHSELSSIFSDELLQKLFIDFRESGQNACKSLLPSAVDSDIVNLNTSTLNFMIPILGNSAFGLKSDSNFNEELKKLNATPPSKWFSLINFVIGVYPQVTLLLNFIHKPDKNLVQLIDKIPKNNSDNFNKLWEKLQLCDDTGGMKKYDNEKRNQLKSYLFFQNSFQLFSPLLIFSLYELATNLDVQDKLRKEINKLFNKIEDLTYQSVSKKYSYLDMVLKEVLRKYPVNPVIERTCIKDYKVENSREIINKGSLLFIPVIGIHHDSKYHPNPEKFDPERFATEKSTKDFTYLPFGGGKRTCIGKTFGILPVKIALIMILKMYQLSECSVTPSKIEFNPNVHFLAANHDVWLKISKIQ